MSERGDRVSVYQRLLDEEIGTPPPSTVDIDRTIRRRRRILRVQRIGGAVSALAVVALVAAFVVPAGRPGAPARVGAPPPSLAPSGSPAIGGDGGAPRTDEPTAVRLTEVLRQAMNTLLPQAEFRQNRMTPPETVAALVFNHRFRHGTPDRGGEDYFFATADVTQRDGTGSVMVMVGRIDPDLFSVVNGCPDEGPLDATGYVCTPSVGPRGETVITTDMRRGERIVYEVAVTRADGIGVSVGVSNSTFANTHNDVRNAPLPPLTVAQARALALDPALTL